MGSIDNHNPGYRWYAAVGRHEGAAFRVLEFVRCNRGSQAATRRAVKAYGSDAAVYYRPTGCYVSAAEWLNSYAQARANRAMALA